METKSFTGWLKHFEKELPNIIPPMTHPYGKAWSAPDRSEIIVCDKFATMSKEAFDKLLDYSRSQPTGVYEGKMWKSSDDRITWHLHWWSKHEDPNVCKGNVREIKIAENESDIVVAEKLSTILK